MERALAFYHDSLGGEVLYSSAHWSTVKVGDTLFGLHGRSETLPKNGFVPCLTVEGFESYVDLTDTHDVPAGTIRTVTDPDGNRIQLLVEAPGS